ncbi:MAG: killer suppression protein HigA [Bacteroidetes bacterium]|nr:killer suppression protein HigA [Bacteroidota bacterium]
MNITFANKKLKKQANNFALAQKKLGNDRATKYHQRIGDMRDVESFNDLQFLPGNFHNLSSNRNGQWSCNLDHPYRLIFEPATQPVPTNEHGTPILTEIRIVKIIEIVDYH